MVEAAKEAPKKEETKPAVNALRELTLPELTGLLTTRIMKALQGTDSGVITGAINSATGDLKAWYDAQPSEGRKDLARTAKKSMEQFRLISEQLFHSMVTITLSDM